MTVLGKFAVVMADPPWDIHMEVQTFITWATRITHDYLQFPLCKEVHSI